MKLLNKGFTLLEVICAMFLLGLALVALQRMVSTGLKGSTIVKDRLIAYNLLEWEMEYRQGVSFTDSSLDVGTYNTPVSDLSDLNNSSIEVIISNDDNGTLTDSSDDLKTIQTTISWTNAFNETVSETVSAYRANH